MDPETEDDKHQESEKNAIFEFFICKKFAKVDPISDHLYFSTCCFDFLLSGLGESLCSYGQSLGQFTVSQYTYTIENVLQNTCFNESCRINNSVGIETIQLFNIDFSIFLS